MKLFKFGKKQQQQQRTQKKTRRINGWIYYFLLINIIYINSNVAFGVVFRLNAWRKACNGKRHQNLLPFRNCYEKTASHSFACENIEATIRPHVASLAFCMWIFLIEIHLDSFFFCYVEIIQMVIFILYINLNVDAIKKQTFANYAHCWMEVYSKWSLFLQK